MRISVDSWIYWFWALTYHGLDREPPTVTSLCPFFWRCVLGATLLLPICAPLYWFGRTRLARMLGRGALQAFRVLSLLLFAAGLGMTMYRLHWRLAWQGLLDGLAFLIAHRLMVLEAVAYGSVMLAILYVTLTLVRVGLGGASDHVEAWLDRRAHRRHQRRAERLHTLAAQPVPEGHFAELIIDWLAAKKARVCPRIEFAR